jgi:hypothetical protein
MTLPLHTPLEIVTHQAPFGIGLWDTASGSLVSEGIDVRIYQLVGARAVRPIAAFPNRSGVFVSHRLPGVSTGADANDLASILSPPKPFLVAVRDTSGDFTSFVMHLVFPTGEGPAVPVCMDALWPGLVTSPLAPLGLIPLFSTPSRAVRAGLAIVRASIFVADTGQPAEFAVLEISHEGRLAGRGVADRNGQVAVSFAYPEVPEPPASPASSPPASPPAARAAQPLANQQWPLGIAVRYARNLPRHTPHRIQPPPVPASRMDREAPLADLCELITQPLAPARTDTSPAPLTAASLRYGEELLLGADSGAKKLFISPV